MPSNPKQRFTLSALKLEEISLVDNPANKGARVVLYKRGEGMNKALHDAMTDAEKRKFKEFMDQGMSEKDAAARVMREMRKEAGNDPGEQGDQEGTMDVKELQSKLEGLESQVAELTTAKEAAEAHVAAVDEAVSKAGFTVAKADDGKVSVSKSGKDEEETIEFNGEQIAKSAIPAPVLKQLEEDRAALRKMAAEREAEKLAKRADTEFPNLGGSSDQKGKLLKAVESIEDEADRKAVTEALKAADAAVSKTFKEVGKAASEDENSATFKLEKMAKDHAAEHNVDYHTAFANVTKSGEGKRLWVESRNEQN